MDGTKPKLPSINDLNNQLPSISELNSSETPAQESVNPVADFAGNFDKSFVKAFTGIPKAVAIAAHNTVGRIPGLGGSLESDPLYQAGDWLDKKTEEWFPTNATHDSTLGKFVTEDLPSTAGTLLAFAMGGRAGSTTKIADLAIPTATKAVLKNTAHGIPAAFMASAGTASEEYKKALEATGDENVALETFTKNLGSGLPFLVSPTIKKFDQLTGGKMKYVLGKSLEGGLTGAFQMASSHFLTNATAEETYDKTRSLVDGVLQSGGSGFAINAFLTGLSAAVGGKGMAAKYVEKAKEKTKDLGNTDFYKEPDPEGDIIESVTKDLSPELKAQVDAPIEGVENKFKDLTTQDNAVQEQSPTSLDVREQPVTGKGVPSTHPEESKTTETRSEAEAQPPKIELTPEEIAAQKEQADAKTQHDLAYEEWMKDQTDENAKKLLEAQQRLTQSVEGVKASKKNPWSDKIKELEEESAKPTEEEQSLSQEELQLKRARYLIEQFPDQAPELSKLLSQASGKNKTKTTTKAFLDAVKEAANVPRKVVTNEKTLLKDQIRNFARGIFAGRLDAKTDIKGILSHLKDTVGKLKLSDKTHKSILNKIGGVFKNPKTAPEKIARLNDYIDKVATDAAAAEQIHAIESLQESIKNKYKTKFPRTQHDVIRKLVNADVTVIKDLPSFIDALQKVDAHSQSVLSEKFDRAPVMEEITLIAEQAARDTERAAMVRKAEKFDMMGIDSEINDFLSNDAATEEMLSEAKKAETRQILTDMIEPIHEELQDLTPDTRDPIYDKVHRSFKNITPKILSKLSLNDLKLLVRKLDQIVTNGDYAATDDIAARIDMADHADRMDTFAKEMSGKRGFSNTSATIDFLFNHKSDKAARFYTWSGLGKVRNADVSAKNDVHDLKTNLKNLRNKLLKKDKHLITSEKLAKAQVYSSLIQVLEGADEGEALLLSKDRVRSSIEAAYRANYPKLGDSQKAAFEPFEKTSSVEEIKSIMAKNEPVVKEFVDGIVEILKPYRSKAEAFAEVVQGKKLNTYKNYIPEGIKGVGGTKFEEPHDFSMSPVEAKSLKERVNTYKGNEILNSDKFFETVFQNMSQVITNYHVEPTKNNVNAFFGMDAANNYKWTRGLQGHDYLKDYIEKSVYLKDKAGNVFPSNLIGDFATRQAVLSTLSGVKAGVKQYGPGLMKLMWQYKDSPSLIFKNGANTEWGTKLRKEFPTGSRSKRYQGIYANDVTASEYDGFVEGVMGKLVDKQEWIANHTAGKTFAKGDANIAERAWHTRYLDYLKNQGVDVSNPDNAFWKNEYDLRNEPLRHEAQTAAESYVSTNMMPSSGRENAPIMNRLPKEAKMFIPFLSYQISLGQRMQDRWSTVLGGTKSERITAANALTGDLIESVAFSYLFTGLIVNTLNDYLVEKYLDMHDIQESDEEKKIRQERRNRAQDFQLGMSIVPNPMFQLLSGFTGNYFANVYNDLMYKQTADENMKFSDWVNQEGVPVYDTGRGSIPIIDVLTRGLGRDWEIEGDELVYRTGKGDEVRRPITSDEKDMLEDYWLAMALQQLGLKDFSDVMKTAERIAIKHIKSGKREGIGSSIMPISVPAPSLPPPTMPNFSAVPPSLPPTLPPQ